MLQTAIGTARSAEKEGRDPSHASNEPGACQAPMEQEHLQESTGTVRDGRTGKDAPDPEDWGERSGEDEIGHGHDNGRLGRDPGIAARICHRIANPCGRVHDVAETQRSDDQGTAGRNMPQPRAENQRGEGGRQTQERDRKRRGRPRERLVGIHPGAAIRIPPLCCQRGHQRRDAIDADGPGGRCDTVGELVGTSCRGADEDGDDDLVRLVVDKGSRRLHLVLEGETCDVSNSRQLADVGREGGGGEVPRACKTQAT